MQNANCQFLGLATWILFCIHFEELTIIHAAEEQTVTVNTAKWAQIIGDRFLSLTVDPETILFAKDIISDTRILKLSRGLAPSYLRIGSPSINHYHFKNTLSGEDVLSNRTITESQWTMFNDFARGAGLDVIVCISALQRLNGVWDPRNALDLISFSDKMGYKMDWELGYELQKMNGQVSAEQLAMDVNRLRSILNSFTYYKHSIIVGPDITNLYTQKDIDFLRDFLQEAGSSLDAITWHPKYLSTSSHLTTSEEFDYMLERLSFEKEGLTKLLGRQISRKPIWLAESDRSASQGYFIDALNWAHELGSFVGFGIHTVMKQFNLQELLEISPSYWLSLLHKALVGQVVLDVRHSSINNTNVPVFCHCTNTIKKSKVPELIVTDKKYEPGAITFFAVNKKSSAVKLSLKLSSGMKQGIIELHQYLLTADQTMSDPLLSRNILLNGKRLTVEHTGDLPKLLPDIEHTEWNLTVSLPPVSIGFWVIPRANVKLCVSASKKSFPHRNEMHSQPLVKVMPISSYINSHITRNSEILSRDLKHSDNVVASKNETTKEYYVDESKTRTFKHKKHHTLKDRKVLEKKNQDHIHIETVYENETGPLLLSKSNNDSHILSLSTDKEHGLEVQDNYAENISIEQKNPMGRFKRYAPENNNALSFSGVPLDLFQQPTLTSRAPKARRKKKAELKSDKKEEREQRKDKLKQKDDNLHATLFDPFLTSIENEEQYFHHMKRVDNEIRPFPSGDIYLKQGDSSEEQRNSDYDYVDRDEKKFKEYDDEVDDMDAGDIDLSLKPGEFFENIRGTRDKINEQFVGYGGELWEAETFTMATPTDKMDDIADDEDTYDQEVIHESGPTEEEDRKRKAAAAKLLNSYLTEGYAEKQSEENKHKDKISKKTRIQRKTERNQEYAEVFEDSKNYFFGDHKEKNSKLLEKPTHHHHHHHHITGHSKPTKESKQTQFDHVHTIHNYKDKTRKLNKHNERHLFSEEDDIFFPHITHESERELKRSHAFHRALHSSEEKMESMKNSPKVREKPSHSNYIKYDGLHSNKEHFEGSSTSTKSSRQSRAKKVTHKAEEEGNANAKSKIEVKNSENGQDNNLSGMSEESNENIKVIQQTDKQQKNKNNKPSTSTGSSDYSYREKDIHDDKKKSKERKKYFESGRSNKHEEINKNSEEVDLRNIENDAKLSKRKMQVMVTNESFENKESNINSGEIIENESEEHDLDPDSAEDTDKRSTSTSPRKTNHKISMRNSSDIFEDVKVKSSKHKEQNTNYKSENMKAHSSILSLKNNEKEGHRKPKRIESSSEDPSVNSHTPRKVASSRKSFQLNDYSYEEAAEKTHPNKSSIKIQDSKLVTEKRNENKQRSLENSSEQENDLNHSTEENSLEHSNRLETTSDDAQENLSIASSQSEQETKHEPLSNEDLSIEDISTQNKHMHSQQKSLNVPKSKYKTNTKHISEESLLEDNISIIQGEHKKKHTSSENYSEANKELGLISEMDKLEEESKHNGEAESLREKPRASSDVQNEKASREKESKRKNGKHKTTKKNDHHHNRARREIISLLSDDYDHLLNHNSEVPNKDLPLSVQSKSLPDINLGFIENVMHNFVNNASKFIGKIVAENNDVKLEPNMHLVPEQYVKNEEYLAGDVLEHSSGQRDFVLKDMLKENTQSNKALELNFEDGNDEDEISGTWTFRNDNSIQSLYEQDGEPLTRENNAKREIGTKTFENAILQSRMNKEEANMENISYESSFSKEYMNNNEGKETSFERNGDTESNRYFQFQNPVDTSNTQNSTHVSEKVVMQNKHAIESSRNGKNLSNEEKIPGLSLKVNQHVPIHISNERKSARGGIISKENEFQNLSKENRNEEVLNEELLYSKENRNEELLNEELFYSKENSNEMRQPSLELKSGFNQYVEKDNLKDISIKTLAAPEYVDKLPIDFSTAYPASSLGNETQRSNEPIVKMLAPEREMEVSTAYQTHEGHNDNIGTEDNEPVESKFHASAHVDNQFERVPKAMITNVIENTSNTGKLESIDFEGRHIINPAEEARNSEEDISGNENTEKYNILQSSSKELARKIELLDGISTTLYDQERSVRDTNIGEPASLSSLSPETNDNNDAPTKVSLVGVNENARNNAHSNVSPNISKEIFPNERSSSVSDVKKIKGLKPLALPKKNSERIKLEQKYKERIQQIKERRAKIKAGLFKKPDTIQIKKGDNMSTNKKIRKRRAIAKENIDHHSSFEHIDDDENLSDQENANTFDSSSDSWDEKSLNEPTSLWFTDYGTHDSSEEQPYNFKLIPRTQYTTPHLLNTDIYVTPSDIVTEPIGNFDHHISAQPRSSEISDTISIPVTLHKTLLITENNPFYADEEAIRDKIDPDVTNNDFSSEEVFVKLTAPLINYESLTNLQQGKTYFHKLIPVQENDIDVLRELYNDDYESGNAEVMEGLDLGRPQRYVSFLQNNFQPWSFTEPSNAKEHLNNKFFLKDPFPIHEKNIIDVLPMEPNIGPDNPKDALTMHLNNNNWFIEDTSTKSESNTIKEAMITPGAIDFNNGIVFPSLEDITDIETAKTVDHSLVNEETFAVRSKRALKMDYDPLNDDLLLPFIIPIMPENKKSLEALLNKKSSEHFNAINNKIDSLQVTSSESDMKKKITNEHIMMNINQKGHTAHNFLRKLVSPKNVNDNILGSNSLNKVSNSAENINNTKVDASLIKGNLINSLHPNSLDFHILDFGQKEAGYMNKKNGLNLNFSNGDLDEVSSKLPYKYLNMETSEHLIPNNNEDINQYLYPNLKNYSPVKKLITEYRHIKNSNINTDSLSAESYALLKDEKNTENINSSDYDNEGNLNMNTNLLNSSHPKHTNSNEELSFIFNLYLKNSTNAISNDTSSPNFQEKLVNNHREGILHSKVEDAIAYEGNSLVHNKSIRALTKEKYENEKTVTDPLPSTLHGILKIVTASVFSFLHHLFPWKASAD